SSDVGPPPLTSSVGGGWPLLSPLLSSTPTEGVRKRRRITANPGGLHWTATASRGLGRKGPVGQGQTGEAKEETDNKYIITYKQTRSDQRHISRRLESILKETGFPNPDPVLCLTPYAALSLYEFTSFEAPA
ncbi:hypothetical protein KUCAC02_032635, partial [Chaenocephalus aceratus]